MDKLTIAAIAFGVVYVTVFCVIPCLVIWFAMGRNDANG